MIKPHASMLEILSKVHKEYSPLNNFQKGLTYRAVKFLKNIIKNYMNSIIHRTSIKNNTGFTDEIKDLPIPCHTSLFYHL